jgi:hypothetical protein
VPDDEEEKEDGRESDEGYFGVTKTCSCNLQLIHQSCELPDYILLLCIIQAKQGS